MAVDRFVQRQKNLTEDWQISTHSIQERGKYLLENKIWADCKFRVGTEDEASSADEFAAHKLILSMASPVFATMFHGGLPEVQSPIKIIDIQPDAFKSMLEYIYTDTVNIESVDQACELCYAAKKYMMPHLLNKCISSVWSDVDCDTALRAYEFAKLFDDLEVAEKSMQIIREKTADVLSKAGAMNMSKQTLLDILDQDQLNVPVPSEVYLFNILQSWVMFNMNRSEEEKYDADKVRTFARDALQRIRFLTMNASDFADGPAHSQMLTKDESFAILLNISSPYTKYQLPEGFSTSRIQRTDPCKRIVCLSRKIYISRPITDASVQLNNGCLSDMLYFKTSDDITLLGIQIPAQILHFLGSTCEESLPNLLGLHIQSGDEDENENNPSATLIPKSKYHELLVMFVKEVHNPRNNWFTHVVSLVEHNSILDIMLTSPAVIKRGHEYELTVTLNKEGYYLVGSFDEPIVLHSDGVKFTIDGNTNTAFISSLIFTH